MLTRTQIETYHRDGYAVVENAVRPDLLARINTVVAAYVEKAQLISKSDEIYDLENSHTPEQPRVRRINAPVNRDPVFWELIRDEAMWGPVAQLIGGDLRLYGSKLNMKSAGHGAAVEWHQDWAFYPHTNDDVCAIGVMLDDVTMENGPLMVLPGSHTGPVHDHRSDGYFVGGIEAANSKLYLSKAVPLTGKAGSMSIHHVRLVHGSALNLSNKPRRILFYEIAAADAWPLWTNSIRTKYNDFSNMFDEQMIVGTPTLEPRMVALPVRMPGPFRGNAVGLYQLQTEAKLRYFGTYAEKSAKQST